jgi:hypothetical protein
MGPPLAFRYFSNFSVSRVMIAASSTMLVVDGVASGLGSSTAVASLTGTPFGSMMFSSLAVSFSGSFATGARIELKRRLCLLLSGPGEPLELLLNHDPKLSLFAAERSPGILTASILRLAPRTGLALQMDVLLLHIGRRLPNVDVWR